MSRKGSKKEKGSLKSKNKSKGSEETKLDDRLTINFVWSEQVQMAFNRIKKQLLCPPRTCCCNVAGVVDPNKDIQIPYIDVMYGDILRERKWKRDEKECRQYDPTSLETVVRNFRSWAFNPKRFVLEDENEEKKKEEDNKNKATKKKDKSKEEKIKKSNKEERKSEEVKVDAPKPDKLFKTPCTLELLAARLTLFPNLCLTESSLSLVSIPEEVVSKPVVSKEEVKKKKTKKK